MDDFVCGTCIFYPDCVSVPEKAVESSESEDVSSDESQSMCCKCGKGNHPEWVGAHFNEYTMMSLQ